jgi:hypothetical protein
VIDFRVLANRILSASTRVFGERVEFYPKQGGTHIVRAVFDLKYEAVDLNTEQVVSVNEPILGVNLNDIKWDLSTADRVKIRGVMFRIQDKREDGLGGARLYLHKASVNERIADTRVR